MGETDAKTSPRTQGRGSGQADHTGPALCGRGARAGAAGRGPGAQLGVALGSGRGAARHGPGPVPGRDA